MLLVNRPCQNSVIFSTMGVGEVAIRSIQCHTDATHGPYHWSSRSLTAAGTESAGLAVVSSTRSTAAVQSVAVASASICAGVPPKPARRSRKAASARGMAITPHRPVTLRA